MNLSYSLKRALGFIISNSQSTRWVTQGRLLRRAVAEFRRVARPGARLVISVPHPPEWFPNAGHVVEGCRAEEITRLVEAAGWRVLRTEYCMLEHFK